MRDTIKGACIGALVAAFTTVLLAQTWTTPRTWATDDLLTADQFNVQFRDNLLRLRADTQLTGTAALDALGCGTRGGGQVLYSDCDWAALPAGVVFDIHDDVTTAETISNVDRMPFSDESSNGDPMRYTTASLFAAYVRTTIPAGTVFDIHDDLTSETIADTDRLAFSDEGSAGDPMRFTTAANLADYMQVEVELDASRVTGGSFNTARIPDLSAGQITSDTFDTARIPNLPASKITSGPFHTALIPDLPAGQITSDTFDTARIPNLSAAKLTSGTLPNARLSNIPTNSLANDAVTQAKIADNAVGVAQLKTATGTFDWAEDYINLDTHRFSFVPRVSVAGSTNNDACLLQGIKSNLSNSEVRTLWQAHRGNFAAATCTANWDYVASSDDPSIWAITQDVNGGIVALFEAEDPAGTGPPISVPQDDDGNDLPGYTAVNVGLPSLAVIEALYGGLTATVRAAALSCTGDYVTGRGWLQAFTGLPALSTIEARYEPSGRQWAMRCGAQASDEAVTTFYLDSLVVDAGVWAVAP